MKHTNLLTLFATCMLLLSAGKSAAQEALRFKYFFHQTINPKGILVEEIPAKVAGGNSTYRGLNFTTTVKVGKVTINKTHDTLALSPWYYTGGGGVPNAVALRKPPQMAFPIDPDHTYTYAIDWTTSSTTMRVWGKKYKIISIPFSYSQFAVMSLPFRIDLRTGDFKSEFLNANLTYLFIQGQTRFYKSKFLDPRSSYWGFGPYIGASTIEDDEKVNHFGFNYGINGVRSVKNINLTLAIGAESAFNSKTYDFTPYVGIGFGLKIIELFEPKNTDD